MPIRQAKGKWYWGTQGPFDSKKKAQEVARAAHSSGYTKKSSDKAAPGSRPMENPSSITADELNRKLRRATRGGKELKEILLKYGVQDFGNSQEDALKRGANQPKGWKRNNADDDETSMDKFRTFVKFDQQRSTNHPAYPSTFQGKLGVKRIDWRKKKDPNFEKHTRVGTPTDSVYQTSMDTAIFMKELWLQKFMDISRQRVIAYILKEAEEEEPKEEKPPKGEEPTELDADTPTEEPTDKPTPVVDKPVTVAGALQWDTATMGPMPETRIEINDPDDAPKGTRLIEGPREGLYYDGAASDGAQIEDHTYSDEFDRLRKQVRWEAEQQQGEGGVGSLSDAHELFNNIEIAYSKYILDEINKINPDVVAEYEGHLIPIDADAFQEINRNDLRQRPEMQRLALDYADAHNALVAARERVEPMQAEAMNALLKVFSKLPQPQIGIPNIDEDPAYELNISPDVTVMQDDDGLYGHWLATMQKRQTVLKFLHEVNVQATNDLSPEQRVEMRKRTINTEMIAIRGENTGASYLGLEGGDVQNRVFGGSDFKNNTILVNPYTAQGLFGDNTEKYLGAVQILLHEAVHSVNPTSASDDKIQEMMGILTNSPHPVTRAEVFGTGGFQDLITYPANNEPGGLAFESPHSDRVLEEHAKIKNII